MHDSIKLDSSASGNDAHFLENHNVVLFITPDGFIQEWDFRTKKFHTLPTPPLKEIICPTLDGHKRKLYFFTGDGSLFALDLGGGIPDCIGKLDCKRFLNATLISGMEDMLLI